MNRVVVKARVDDPVDAVAGKTDFHIILHVDNIFASIVY